MDRRHQGEHRHQERQRRRKLLSPDDAGPGRVPGGLHQRAHQGRPRRAKAESKKLGRPPALDQKRILEAQRIYAENPPIRRTARIINVSQGTVKKALGSGIKPALAGNGVVSRRKQCFRSTPRP